MAKDLINTPEINVQSLGRGEDELGLASGRPGSFKRSTGVMPAMQQESERLTIQLQFSSTPSHMCGPIVANTIKEPLDQKPPKKTLEEHNP